jgi:hypothetical protein
MTIPAFPETKVALRGRKSLVVRHRERSVDRVGCAKAFRALGADVAVTRKADLRRRTFSVVDRATLKYGAPWTLSRDEPCPNSS